MTRLLFYALLCGIVLTPSPAWGQEWADFQTARSVQGESAMRVEVKYGAGKLTLLPTEGAHLYRVRMRYDESTFEPVHTYSPGRLEVGVTGTGSTRSTNLGRGGNQSELDLFLTRELPLDLSVNFGAGRAEMDLGGLRLTGFSLATGAATAQLRISEPNRETMADAHIQVGAASFQGEELGNLRARSLRVEAGAGDVTLDMGRVLLPTSRVEVSMGVGSLTIRVPEEVGVQMERSSFLASVSAPGFVRRGNQFTSPNWDQATTRITVKVEAFLGSVSVVQGSR